MSNNRSEIQYVHGEKMKKLHSSNRGLTFSITPNEQYYPGGHYIYEVRPTCIIIRPSKSGLKISKKRSGANINALFDLRSKKVRDAVSRCSHMEMEVLQDKIIVRCIRSIKDKIVPIERVLAEFSVSKVVLKAAAGIEGQISIAEYLDSIGFSDWNTTVNEEVRSVFSVMSLFSGAGMLDWPFHLDPAFEINYACDSDAAACESYRHNIGNHIMCRDVQEVSGKIPPQHLIIGGPSCKPFSSSNRRRRMENHEDVDLVDEYIRITQENCPEIFVIENVPQFITCESGKFLSKVLQKLSHRYTITSNIVRDCDIGGYTTRKRAIIIGSRIGKIQLPQLKLYPFHTVREALSKVTSKWYNYFDVTTSRPETEKRMALVRPGHNFKDIPEFRDNKTMHSDRYYRLDYDSVSPTIVNWRKLPIIHPTENRTLTVAEASALMGFDQRFEFHGTIGERQQQCGNGCTYAIGSLIKKVTKEALLRYHCDPILSV